MGNHGVPPTIVEIVSFGGFNLVAFFNIVFVISSVKQPVDYIFDYKTLEVIK
jgi:hypothetical protein